MFVAELVDRLVVLLIVFKTHGEVGQSLLARSIAIVYPIIQVHCTKGKRETSVD